MKGRKPKPPHLRLLEGNPGKRPIPENHPKPKPIAPQCPAWLDSEAKREWRRVKPELETLGLLTQIDRAALASYCQAYSLFRRASVALSERGLTSTTENGYVQQRPEVGIMSSAMKQIRAFCTEFGMTPSSRGRMTLPGREDDDDEEFFNPQRRSA